MATYVALLRGIGPMNPNMKGPKLKGVLEKLGFKNVSTVINSGNVVFDSPSKNIAAMEKKIEAAWPKQLGFKSTTIIRSQDDIEKLMARKPFAKTMHGPKNYLVVTFLKKHSPKLRALSRKGQGFKIHGIYEREVAVAVDIQSSGTPDMMRAFEKEFGKEITTRTWKTIGRIQKKMSA